VPYGEWFQVKSAVAEKRLGSTGLETEVKPVNSQSDRAKNDGSGDITMIVVKKMETIF